ncbi:MAG: hypothetical protein A2X12_00275 [Bacteroidetes bacterium GWE2_29_8]|nr:MAG: hypothetical protein A2X12_00275 [Bacteroidetes bacterium GWE2_29_8]OFY19355.1 MAG: hypothetical protein A2X02_04735 [Bacteroidetes bacterium GWF2_29_10]
MKNYPLLGGLLFFILGIICFYYNHELGLSLLILTSLFPFLLIIKQTRELFSNIYIHFLIYAAGYFITFANTSLYSDNFFGKYINTAKYFVVKIDRIEKEKENQQNLLGNIVYKYNKQNGLGVTKGRVLLKLFADNKNRLKEGEYVIVPNVLRKISKPYNPFMFDSKDYRNKMDVYYYASLTIKQLKKTGIIKQSFLVKLKYRAQSFIKESIGKFNFDKPELGIITALIIGDKSYLEYDLKDKYSKVGIIHVLCISGLHVGIIYLMISLLLNIIPRNKYTIILQALLSLILLWSYVIITGLSPSAQRAGIMFSFVIINNLMIREGKLINSLVSSAFISLVINPYDIFALGFQLSYLAVLGIAIFYQRLYDYLLKIKQSMLLNKLYKLIAISLSAQIFIIPIIMYQFNNFPVWFLFINVIVIPLIPIIICLIIGLIVFSNISVISSFLFMLINELLVFINRLVEMFYKLQPYYFQSISISFIETLALYGVILFLIIYLYKNRRRIYLLLSMLIIIALLIFEICKEIEQAKQRIFTVYNIPQHSALSVIIGKKAYIFCDSSLLKKQQLLDYNIQKHLIHCGIKSKTLINIHSTFYNDYIHYSKYGIISFNKKKIVIIKDKLLLEKILNKKIEANFVVFTNVKFFKYSLINNNVIVNDKIIFDSTCGPYCLNKANIDKRQYYNVYHNYAYSVTLD